LTAKHVLAAPLLCWSSQQDRIDDQVTKQTEPQMSQTARLQQICGIHGLRDARRMRSEVYHGLKIKLNSVFEGMCTARTARRAQMGNEEGVHGSLVHSEGCC
jgi:hypothetical protein